MRLGKPAGIRMRPGSGWTVVAVSAAAFAWASNLPLYHSDLWGHLSYGRFIWETGHLPLFEPFMPLARNTPIMATAWLSQLLGYGTWRLWSHSGLQVMHGLLLAMAVLFWSRSVCVRLGWWQMAGAIAWLLVCRDQLAVIRPQLAGLVLFCAVLALLERRPRRTRPTACVVAGLFFLWANLHPSFPIGIAVLCAAFAGRIFDVTFTQRRLVAAVTDPTARQLLAWLLIAVAAVICNPYGARLFPEILRVSSNPNLRTLLDWQPLTLARRQGRDAAVLAGAAVLVLAVSPRRLRTRDWLLLSLVSAGALEASRMLIWWGPLAAQIFTRHGHAVARRLAERQSVRRRQSRRLGSGLTVTAIVVAVLVSPLPRLVSGHDLPLAAVVSSETPINAGDYLVSHPAGGLVYCRNTWGDYFVWVTRGTSPVMVTSHVHLIPRDVWIDYLAIAHNRRGCLEILERRRVRMAVVGRRQSGLRATLAADSRWREVFTDDRSAIFVRSDGAQKKGVPVWDSPDF